MINVFTTGWKYSAPEIQLLFDAYFSFIVSGCVGLVQYWLKTGMKETPQQLARLTEQVIRKGIGVLDTDPFADIENVRS